LGLNYFDGTTTDESEYGTEQMKLLYSGKPCVYTDSVFDTAENIYWADDFFNSRDGFSRKQTKKNIQNLYGLKKGDVVVARSAFQPLAEDGVEIDGEFFDAQHVVEQDKFFFKEYGFSEAFKTNFKNDERVDGLVSLFRENGFNVKIVQDAIFPWRGLDHEWDKLGGSCQHIDGAVAYFANNQGEFARAYIFKDGVIVNSADSDCRYADIFFPMGDDIRMLFEKIVATKI
jgi:hypothetical protein